MPPLRISSAASSWETVNEADGAHLSKARHAEIFNSIRTLHRTEAAPSHDGAEARLSWWPSMRQLSRALLVGEWPGDAVKVEELPKWESEAEGGRASAEA